MSMIEINTGKTMREIAGFVSSKCGDKYGFMVLVFKFNASGEAAHYISNAKREDMIKTLREKADTLERGGSIEPNEDIN